MRGGRCFILEWAAWDGMGWDVCVRERNELLVGRWNEREGGGFSWYGMVWYTHYIHT